MISIEEIETLDFTEFEKLLRRKIPNKPGVYILVDENGIPQYVGQSNNLRYRLSNHHKKCQFLGCLITWLLVPETNLIEYENYLIDLLKPCLNGTGKYYLNEIQAVFKVSLHKEVFRLLEVEAKQKGVSIERLSNEILTRYVDKPKQ